MVDERDGLYPNSQTPPLISRLGSQARLWDEIHGTSGQFNDIVATDRITVSGIQFDTTSDESVHTPGLLFWDDNEKALSYYTDEADIKMQIGQELWIFGRNKTGSTITNGTIVRVTGAQGNRPLLGLARAASGDNVEGLIGMATHDIEHNSDGYVTVAGVINDVETSGSDGDELYLSATVSGAFTATRPDHPDYVVHVGHTLVAHNTQGKILVTIDQVDYSDPVTFYHMAILDRVHMYGNITVGNHDTSTIGQSPTSGFKDVFATSGHLASGVIVTAPNGSGWRMSVDNDGNWVSNGPFVL